MKQSEFIKTQSASWTDAEKAILSRKNSSLIPATYRTLCQHLALAETRGYSEKLVKYLRQLVLQYHSKIYARKNFWFINLWNFFSKKFPASVRENRVIVLIAASCFFIPLLIAGIVAYLYPDSAYYMFSYEQLSNVRDMYNPENHVLGRERAEDGDWYMFGFYLYNNTSIGFRTFAAGLLMGFGTAFMLLFNAVYIGVVAGYLVNLGYSSSFFSFVSGHSSFELMAIALSGAAGFILGRAMINPGQYKRKLALQLAARKAMPVIQGAMSFFFIAAMIEAFWSSHKDVELIIKIFVGVFFWVIILAYLLFSGRGKDGDHSA